MGAVLSSLASYVATAVLYGPLNDGEAVAQVAVQGGVNSTDGTGGVANFFDSGLPRGAEGTTTNLDSGLPRGAEGITTNFDDSGLPRGAEGITTDPQLGSVLGANRSLQDSIGSNGRPTVDTRAASTGLNAFKRSPCPEAPPNHKRYGPLWKKANDYANEALQQIESLRSRARQGKIPVVKMSKVETRAAYLADKMALSELEKSKQDNKSSKETSSKKSTSKDSPSKKSDSKKSTSSEKSNAHSPSKKSDSKKSASSKKSNAHSPSKKKSASSKESNAHSHSKKSDSEKSASSKESNVEPTVRGFGCGPQEKGFKLVVSQSRMMIPTCSKTGNTDVDNMNKALFELYQFIDGLLAKGDLDSEAAFKKDMQHAVHVLRNAAHKIRAFILELGVLPLLEPKETWGLKASAMKIKI